MLRDFIPSGFDFGVSVDQCLLHSMPELIPIVTENFTSIIPANNFKLKTVFGQEDKLRFGPCDWMADFCNNNQLKLHGHGLLHGYTDLIYLLPKSNLEIEKFLKKSIKTLVSRYKETIIDWDCLCEVVSPRGGLTNTFWRKRLGPNFPAKVFRWAHEANPEARLYYSDYGLKSENKRQAVLQLCYQLKSEGVPIHGLSIQIHKYTKGITRLQGIKKAIKECQDLGLDVRFPEVTIWKDLTGLGDFSEAIQSMAYEKVLDLAIAENCSQFSVWSPFDFHCWRGLDRDPGIWDDNLNPKLTYFGLEKVLRRWKKKESGDRPQAPDPNAVKTGSGQHF